VARVETEASNMLLNQNLRTTTDTESEYPEDTMDGSGLCDGLAKLLVGPGSRLPHAEKTISTHRQNT
jgi:hypothetical protein